MFFQQLDLVLSKLVKTNFAYQSCFENHMKMDIFSQVYANALLDDPEQATLYYPRTDSLLIALYHKKKLNG